jgi:hypothetical protein
MSATEDSLVIAATPFEFDYDWRSKQAGEKEYTGDRFKEH